MDVVMGGGEGWIVLIGGKRYYSDSDSLIFLCTLCA